MFYWPATSLGFGAAGAFACAIASRIALGGAATMCVSPKTLMALKGE